MPEPDVVLVPEPEDVPPDVPEPDVVLVPEPEDVPPDVNDVPVAFSAPYDRKLLPDNVIDPDPVDVISIILRHGLASCAK